MATDTSRTIEIENSPVKMLGLIAGGFVLISVSLMLALPLFAIFPSDPVAKFVGWFGVVFFSLCTMVGLWRLIAVRGPVVTISPEGIRDTRVAAEFIPWNAVTAISTWKFRGQEAMVLAVPPETEAQLQLTRMARWTRNANRALGADGLCITASGLKIDYPTLLQTSVTYSNAARH